MQWDVTAGYADASIDVYGEYEMGKTSKYSTTTTKKSSQSKNKPREHVNK